MLAGTGPLLGEGELGASVYADGARRSFWYRDGKAGFGDYVQLRVVAPHRLEAPDAPLAVLLGARTASSAEVLAAALRGRPHTRSFGGPTSGLSAGNRTFELTDGAALVLTVAATADRAGRVILGPIVPDEEVLARAVPSDAVLAAAMTWLEAEGMCR
jgi:C-terminal processing protease CtpA/Prc